MARFARIGVIPGERFSTEGLSAQQIKALEAGVAEAKREMKAWWATPKATHNAWNWDLTDRSRFGDNYLNRAAIASQTIYPNAPDHAVYGRLDNDDNGVQWKGSAPHTLTFAADELPPVDWFWSITMYQSSTTAMYANPAERYSVGMKTDGLVYNDDGSLTFTLSHDEPTEAKARANWLPAPEDDYYLILRLYGAKQDVIDGHWAPPAIAKAQ